MIEFIDTRLRAWGQWSTMRLDGDMGMVAACYTEPEMHAGRYCSTPLIQEQCLLTESAVAWLLLRCPALGRTVRYHYRDGVRYSADQCAAFLGVRRRAYFYRIEQAHLEILEYLIAREGGQVPQLTELKQWRWKQERSAA